MLQYRFEVYKRINEVVVIVGSNIFASLEARGYAVGQPEIDMNRRVGRPASVYLQCRQVEQEGNSVERVEKLAGISAIRKVSGKNSRP